MIAAILLVAVPWLGLQFGATELSWQQVWAGLWGYSTSYVERVVMGLRLPRTLVGLMIGVHFALSGGLLQLLTRNPLAEAGILGISARASLVAVAAFVVGIGYKRATTLTGAFPSH
jgi:iron complex transport system permease protein